MMGAKLGSNERVEPEGSATRGVRAEERKKADKYNTPIPAPVR